MNFQLKKIVFLGFALLIFLSTAGFCRAQGRNGFFRVEQRNGVWWLITPDGKPFFSNGVNVVSQGESAAKYTQNNPQYASFRYYKTERDWQNATLKRLREWNFNTIGGWSDENLERRGEMPYVKAFYWGEKIVPWGDVFAQKFELEINEKVKRETAGMQNDVNLIGYFSDNELGWWDDTIFYHFLQQPPENKTRQVLMNVFRQTYKNNFAALKRDFETGKARNFAALEQTSNLTLKPRGGGAKVIDKFVFLIAERYYKTVHDAIRRNDPNHLILGDRYQSWYSQTVARASIPYVDVVSTNYMADWNNGNFSKFYLDSLYRLTKKPIIVTEYYLAARENNSGNKNSNELFPVVQTQKERAAGFQRNLTQLAELPYIVGAHWFQYFDEPTNGRADGEDYNMGLVDINNFPYQQLTASAATIKPEEIHAEKIKPLARLVPEAKKNSEKNLINWNTAQSFVSADLSERNTPFADLYASWDASNLYLAIYAMDFADLRLYRAAQIPESEKMTWTLNFGANSKPLQIRFGVGGAAQINEKSVEFESYGNSTRYTVLLKLPASYFDRENLKTGETVRLQSKLTSHSRAETMRWNQDIKLGEID